MERNATLKSISQSQDSLLGFCARLNEYDSVEGLLTDVAEVTRNTFSADCVLIIQVAGPNNLLQIAAVSTAGNNIETGPKAIELSGYGYISEKFFPIDRPSFAQDDKFTQFVQSILFPGQKLASCIWLDMPVHIRGIPVALLRTMAKDAHPFRTEQTATIKAIAGLTAMAWEAIQLRARSCVGGMRLESFTAAKDHVIHQLSHALKTPIAILMASLKLLEKRLIALPDHSWEPVYQRAQRNLTRLLAVEYEMEDILRQQENDSETSETLNSPNPAFHLTENRNE